MAAAQENWQFTVGQVLYIVLRREHDVVPVQIVEENRRTVLGEGVRTVYTAQLSSDSSGPFLELDPALHEAFESADAIRTALQIRAAAAVDAMVNRAAETAQSIFPGVAVQTSTPGKLAGTDIVDADADGRTTVVLPGGAVIRAKISAPSLG